MNKHPFPMLLAVTATLAAFLSPISVHADTGYVANEQNNTIKRFTPDGDSPVTTTTGAGGVVPAVAGNVVVSELNYNPPGPDDTEFIELLNITGATIDLGGCSVFGYTFPLGLQLAPGAHILVVRDRVAFNLRYGSDLPVAPGQYDTALPNSSQTVTLLSAVGQVILSFTYTDSEPWPVAADGLGRSLVLIAPSSNPDPNNPFNWRPSTSDGYGNPGFTDGAQPPPADPLGDDNLDGWLNLIEYAITIPEVTASLDATDHLTLAFTRNLAADDAIYNVETSSDLQTWSSGDVYRASQANPIGATAVETWRSTTPAAGSEKQFIRLRVTLR